MSTYLFFFGTRVLRKLDSYNFFWPTKFYNYFQPKFHKYMGSSYCLFILILSFSVAKNIIPNLP